MPVQANWVNPYNIETNFYEGQAKLYQLYSTKKFSPEHSLTLGIFKTGLFEGCKASSKLFPLVVGLWDRNGKNLNTDFYSFDNNGILLSHGYRRFQDGKAIVDEEHDLSLEKLVEFGKEIKDMIQDYPVPSALAMHTTFIDLSNNCLRR